MKLVKIGVFTLVGHMMRPQELSNGDAIDSW